MKWIYWTALATLLAACYEDEEIIPTEGLEPYYTLPQGNHDYDEKIMAYHEKYGFYILYDFIPEDVYWTGSNWDEYLGGGNATDRDNLGGNIYVQQADTNRVGEYLNLVEDLFFSAYPDSLLMQLPREFYLCSFLGVWDTGDTVRTHAYRNSHCFAANGCSVELDTMGNELKIGLAQALHNNFISYLQEKGSVSISEDFYGFSDYKSRMTSYTDAYRFSRGFLTASTFPANATKEQVKANDLEQWIKVIFTPYEILNSDTYIPNLDYDEPPVQGILKQAPIIRAKYEFLMNYLKEEYHIDIEKIQYPLGK